MGKMKQVALGLIFGGAAIGLKFHSKSGTHDEMRAKLVETCDKDAACVAAVNEHFDSCFDANYDMGGRRRSAAVDAEGFLKCFNDRSGVEHFALGSSGEESTEATAH